MTSLNSSEAHVNEFGRTTSRRELVESKLKHNKDGIYLEQLSPAYSNSNTWKTVAQETYQHGKNIKNEDVISKDPPKIGMYFISVTIYAFRYPSFCSIWHRFKC